MPDISLIAMIGAAPMSGIVCSAYKASRFGSLPVAYDTAMPGGGADATATSGNAFGGPGQAVLTVPTYEGYWIGMSSGGHISWVESPSPVVPESDVTALVADIVELKGVVFNVMDVAYGAKFDNSTDDTAAIIATIAACAAVGRGIVQLPPRTGIVSANISVPTGVLLRGSGRGRTTLKLANNSVIGGAQLNIVSIVDGATDAGCEDLTIDGNRANGNGTIDASGSQGVWVANTTGNTKRISLRRLGVKSCFRGGTRFAGQDSDIEGIETTDCGWDGVNVTYDVGNPADTSTGKLTRGVRVSHCSAHDNAVQVNSNVSGSYFFTGHGTSGPGKVGWGTLVKEVTFTACHSYQNGLTNQGGVGGHRATANNFVGAESGVNNNPAGCTNVHFLGCTNQGNSDDQFWLAGVTGVTILGGSSDGNVGGSGVVGKGFGVEMQGTTRCHVLGHHITGTGSPGVVLSASDAAATAWALQSRDNIIDCPIDNCGSLPVGGGVTEAVRLVQQNAAYPNLGNRVAGTIRLAGGAGVAVQDANDFLITAIIEDAGNAGVGGSQQGIVLFGSSGMGISSGKIDSIIADSRSGGARTTLFGIQDGGAHVDGLVVMGYIRNCVTAPLSLSGTSNIIFGIPGATNSPAAFPSGGIGAASFGLVVDPGAPFLQLHLTSAEIQFQNNLARIDTTGNATFKALRAAAQMYPADEALTTQGSGGILHSTGVPSNANGSNNDWCISDNGFLYFKTGGVWVQQASADSLLAHLAGAETVTGVKTFTANPVFNAAAIPGVAVTLGAAIAAASAGINSTETQIVGLAIPANGMHAGTTYRITASGVCTSSAANVGHFRARIGTTTLTGNIAVDVSPTAAASGTAVPFQVDILVTVRTGGASGAVIGSGELANNGVTGVSAATTVVAQSTATVALDTTAAKILELTFQAAAATTTCTFHDAAITPIVN